MSDDPAVWLAAELDRREQTARDAQGTWEGVADGWRIRIVDEQGRTVAHLPIRLPTEGTPEDPKGDYATATHIEEHDPRAVLRRVAADRKTLDEHADDGYGDCVRCAGEDEEGESSTGTILYLRTYVPHPCATVRLIAEGYGWAGEQR